MSAQTIQRAFSQSANLISAAKEKRNPFLYGVKTFFYNLITLGFGKSMEKARDERREKETVNASLDVFIGLPQKHKDLDMLEFESKTLHTNFDKKYQIIQEGKYLCLYTGNVSQSSFNRENNFDKDVNSRVVLKTFSNDTDFSTFKTELAQVKQLKEKQQTASKIQAHVRSFQKRLNSKMSDEYGNKQLNYEKKGIKQTFVISAHGVGHSLPNGDFKDGPKGSYKQIIGKDKNNIRFTQIKEFEVAIPFNYNEIEKIFITLGITSFKGATRISHDQYVAHNAGEKHLEYAITHEKHKYTPSYFKTILFDMKKLHTAKYYHFDIKPENIQISTKGPTVVDLDFFSSPQKFISGGTPYYLDKNMLQQQQIEKNIHSDKKCTLFKIKDEYALALTLLNANGVSIPMNNIKSAYYNMREGNLQINLDIIQFVNTYVKKEYREYFTQLVMNPPLLNE